MSGGHFDYLNDRTANEIFGYCLYPDYGGDGFGKAKAARKINPLEDKQLSELCWDMFCLLHSFDWYVSGDTDEENYLADVHHFKDKWLKKNNWELIKREIDLTIQEAREEIYKSLLDMPQERDAVE